MDESPLVSTERERDFSNLDPIFKFCCGVLPIVQWQRTTCKRTRSGVKCRMQLISQYGHSRSPSTVGTRSRVTDFVRRMDLYPSKNRLSIKISNTKSSANDGLDASSSVSPSSSPRITSKISDSAKQAAAHRKNRSPTFQAQWVHDMDMSVSAYGPRLSTLTTDETKLCLFPRTRRRIFGLINFIHFFVGSSYAVKSARFRSIDRGHVASPSRRRTATLYATYVPENERSLDVDMRWMGWRRSTGRSSSGLSTLTRD